jgi:hypothetical protein
MDSPRQQVPEGSEHPGTEVTVIMASVEKGPGPTGPAAQAADDGPDPEYARLTTQGLAGGAPERRAEAERRRASAPPPPDTRQTADEAEEDAQDREGSDAEGPTVAERRRSMAESSDVQGIWDILSTTCWSMLDLEEMFQLLLRALEVAGKDDPVAHSAQLFQRMLTFSAGLLLRSQYYIGRILAGHDRSTRGRAAIFLPHDLTQEHLAQALELQAHLAQLIESQARTARLWQLARRRPVNNPPRRRAARREGQAAGGPHGRNGHGPEGGPHATVR